MHCHSLLAKIYYPYLSYSWRCCNIYYIHLTVAACIYHKFCDNVYLRAMLRYSKKACIMLHIHNIAFTCRIQALDDTACLTCPYKDYYPDDKHNDNIYDNWICGMRISHICATNNQTKQRLLSFQRNFHSSREYA